MLRRILSSSRSIVGPIQVLGRSRGGLCFGALRIKTPRDFFTGNEVSGTVDARQRAKPEPKPEEPQEHRSQEQRPILAKYFRQGGHAYPSYPETPILTMSPRSRGVPHAPSTPRMAVLG